MKWLFFILLGAIFLSTNFGDGYIKVDFLQAVIFTEVYISILILASKFTDGNATYRFIKKYLPFLGFFAAFILLCTVPALSQFKDLKAPPAADQSHDLTFWFYHGWLYVFY